MPPPPGISLPTVGVAANSACSSANSSSGNSASMSRVKVEVSLNSITREFPIATVFAGQSLSRVRLPRELRRARIGDEGRVRRQGLIDERALFEFVNRV